MTPEWPSSDGRIVAIVMLWLASLAIVAYWAAFFSPAGPCRASADRCYLVFERSFPLPDGFVALSAALAAEGLRRRRPAGVLWALLMAGGFFFLAFIDIAYNLGNGMYALRSVGMAIETAINFACLAFAIWLATFCWRRRRAFGA
ncbi:MAG: hypothetical protein QM661_12970 [Solimonas sp.]